MKTEAKILIKFPTENPNGDSIELVEVLDVQTLELNEIKVTGGELRAVCTASTESDHQCHECLLNGVADALQGALLDGEIPASYNVSSETLVERLDDGNRHSENCEWFNH